MKHRRSPLERFKRRCTGHVTARRRCASGCSLQFRQQIDGARGADADRCVFCPEPALLSAPSSPYLEQLPSLRCSWTTPSHPCSAPAAPSTPFDPAAVWICCPSVTHCGSLCGFGCLQVKGRRWREARGRRQFGGRQGMDFCNNQHLHSSIMSYSMTH